MDKYDADFEMKLGVAQFILKKGQIRLFAHAIYKKMYRTWPDR